jgi:geranylgeranylglycerol-phosphate geranylgeranyltransferase
MAHAPQPSHALHPSLAAVEALAALVRPANLAIAGCAILLGARFGGAPVDAWRAHAAVVAAALLLLAGGYAWNDAADIARDRLAHPRRPLPSGRLSARAARAAALALFALGLAVVAALGAGPPAVPLAARALLVAWAPLLLAYRAIADRCPVAKNLLASGLTASAILLGGLLGPAPHRALFPALLACLLSWVRETVKDLGDREGDRAVGHPTWIDSLPAPRARFAVRAAIGILLALIPLPSLLLGYGPGYLALAAGGVGALLVLAYRDLERIDRLERPAPDFRRTALLLKGGMAAGLVALYASGVR